jgi:hypothetical protein
VSEGSRFAYQAVRNAHGVLVPRPLLPLVLHHGNQSTEAIGLLDSGADVNVLPYNIGLELGAVWSEQMTAVTLSGNLAAHEARGLLLTAQIGQIAPTRLAFAWTRIEHVPLILGQVNFFMEYDVCFFRARSSFEVRPARAT